MSTPTTTIVQQTAQKVVNTNPNHIKTYKIIVVGDSNVGKTSLTYRFCEGKFLEAAEATIGVDFRERTVPIEGEDIKMQLWDTAGQERFRKSMVQHYYRNVHAIVIVYDVTNKTSFAELKHWIDECNKHCFTDIPRILVGNKCDEEMVVNTNLAQRFADQYDMPLFETSARLDSHCDNVEAIFLTLAHKLLSQKPLIPKGHMLGDMKKMGGMGNEISDKSSCACW